MLTPAERSLRAQIAAHARWKRDDGITGTAPARRAFLDQFEAQVPASITDPAERARKAEHARQEHFKRLALKSVKARRLAAQARAGEVPSDAATA